MTAAGLCFDATGTLIELREPVGEVYHRVAKRFGVDLPAWRLDDAFRRVMASAPQRGLEGETVGDRREAEVGWWSERIRETFQATDSTARFEDFPTFVQTLFDAYRDESSWRIRDGVVGTLERLRASSHPMVIVSNFDHRLPEVLQALGLESFFITTLIPSMTGARKPERRLFEAAAAALNRPIESVLYVGDDSPQTLAEIAALGIEVIDVRGIAGFAAVTDRLATPATLQALTTSRSDRPG